MEGWGDIIDRLGNRHLFQGDSSPWGWLRIVTCLQLSVTFGTHNVGDILLLSLSGYFFLLVKSESMFTCFRVGSCSSRKPVSSLSETLLQKIMER